MRTVNISSAKPSQEFGVRFHWSHFEIGAAYNKYPEIGEAYNKYSEIGAAYNKYSEIGEA